MALFILLLQFLSRYKDDIFGKGLKISVLLEVFSYAMVSLVVMALPVSVLLSSLMTMGNFGQNYELAAMRSSGVSLPRILRPMFLSTIGITLFSFLLSNYVVTKANLKFHSLLYDVKQVKPSFTLKPGHFYSDIDNYVIRIADKDLKKEMLYDVIIYDHTQGRGNDRIIMADSGKMVVDEVSLFMEMTLFHGVSHQMNKTLQGNKEVFQNARYYFDTLYYEFDLSGFGINRTPEELFATHQYMLNIGQLTEAKDSIRDLQSDLNDQYGVRLQTITHLDSIFPDSNVFVGQPKRIVEMFPQDKAVRIYQKARESCKFAMSLTQEARAKVEAEVRSFRDYDIEYHLKFSLPFSCLIFLLIGAPLGAIIRKGGVGMPILVSVVFYLLFYVLMLQGKKMAQEGVVAVWLGVWLPVLIMTPLAIFVTYESTAERKTLEHPAVYRTVRSIQLFLAAINPIGLLVRITVFRRAISATLRFFMALNPANWRRAQTQRESPIMERLRKMREQGKQTTAAPASEAESPIERRLREIQARKERDAQREQAQVAATSEQKPTIATTPAVAGSVHRQRSVEVYKPGLLTKLLAVFGLADASPGLPGETPAERRLRLLREKQAKRGVVVPPELREKVKPAPVPTPELADEDETPIARRLRELRERKAKEEAGGISESSAQTPTPEPDEDETPIARRLRELRERKAKEEAAGVSESSAQTPTPEPDEDETPIARRLRELRERKAKEAAEAEAIDKPQSELKPEPFAEPEEEETPIQQRLRELRERKAKEAAEEKKIAEEKTAESPLANPKPERKAPELPSPGSEAETPIMQRLRELRERKAREAAETASQERSTSEAIPVEPVLQWGDLESVREDEPAENGPAFEFLMGEDSEVEVESAFQDSGTITLDFLFPAQEGETQGFEMPETSLDFEFEQDPPAFDAGMLEFVSPDTGEEGGEAHDHGGQDDGFEDEIEQSELSESPAELDQLKVDEQERTILEIIPGEVVADEPLVNGVPDELPLEEDITEDLPILPEEIEFPTQDNPDLPQAEPEKEVAPEQEIVSEKEDDIIVVEQPLVTEPLPAPKGKTENSIEKGHQKEQEPVKEKVRQDGPWVETITISGVPKPRMEEKILEKTPKKSWFGRLLGGIFGGNSGDSQPETKAETPIERRLRELREKKERESRNADK